MKDVTGTPAGDIVRPPHSVEIVVDGGDSKEIAQQILANKAGGINTVGETVVVLPGEYDEEITIRFNRPTTIYTWFRLGITLNRSEALPPNYVDLLREVVLENMDALDAGKDVVPQQFMSQLYPDIGAPNWEIIVAAAAEQIAGAGLILWTCREGELLENALEACARWGLHFDAVNDSLPSWKKFYGNDTRKVGATEYWDDKAYRVQNGKLMKEVAHEMD